VLLDLQLNLGNRLLPVNQRLLELLVHLEPLEDQPHLENLLVLWDQVMKSPLYFDTMFLLLTEKVFSKIFLTLHHQLE